MELTPRLKELLYSQVPYAGSDVASHPMVAFLESVVESLNTLDTQVPRVLSVTIAGAATRNLAANAANVQLVQTVTVQAGAAQTVTWASSVPSVASVTVGGLVDILTAGTTVVTATSTFDTSKSASVTFVITP
jgi:hypothetical protein